MTGFRVARGGVQELCGITPDLTALGKVIGGGLPVGAFGGRADDDGSTCRRMVPVYQAGTLSGNPLAMAAGLAQLRELERINAWRQLEENGAAFEDAVRSALKRNGLRYTCNRIGSMFCLFFTEQPVFDLASAQTSDRTAFARYFHACLDRRRVLRSLAVRSRVHLDRAYGRRHGEDGGGGGQGVAGLSRTAGILLSQRGQSGAALRFT